MVFGLIAAVAVALGAVVFGVLAQKKLAVSDQNALEAAAASEAQIEQLAADLEAAEESATDAKADLAEFRSEKQRLASDLQTKSAELEEATAELKTANESVIDLRAELETTTAERDKIAAKLVKDKEALSNAQKEEALSALSGAEPIRASTLWELELTRSARTWRNSVATNPEVVSTPFDDVENPVRSAVEVEAAALREDVGAAVRVDWRAGMISEPARCHLVLRLAQEMMASAAREPQPTVLVIEGDDELSLRIEPDDDAGDTVITLSPPKIESSLIDISSDRGLIVTLKATSPTLDQAEAAASEA